ncbi:MAG: hypothetical protein U1E27_05765, partial [Kiritimatiellia bacterium]|nr:hypothetical protein [Kiritimatiellia bacterium]
EYARENPGRGEAAVREIREMATDILRNCERTRGQYDTRRAGWKGFNPETDDPREVMAVFHLEIQRALDVSHPDRLAEWQDLGEKFHRFGTATQALLFRPRMLTFDLDYRTQALSVAHPDAADFLRGIREENRRVFQDKHWSERHR